MPNEPFVDFYQLLQISPNSEQEAIERVCRLLAARHHPDNPRTGDRERFLKLKQAHEALSNRESRSAYDQVHRARTMGSLRVFESKEFDNGVDGEANRRLGVLCLLYMRRRSDPEAAGFSILDLETLTAFPREHLLFTLWYLKEADFVRQEESTEFVVTSHGVDFLEKQLPSNHALYQLTKEAEAGSLDRNEASAANGA
jgi:curved DNA-binding protein CbpA